MSNEKIIMAWNQMNPDSDTKEKILQQLHDTFASDSLQAAKQSIGQHPRKAFKFAVVFAAVVLLLCGGFGTAYTVSASFREYVHSLLFPLYTSDQMISIDNGHMTGSFDMKDVLLTFLDKFNRQEFGNSITAARENGYLYSLYMQDEDHLLAFVDSSTDGCCIVVAMERLAYEETEGIWQIKAYQILEYSAAEELKKGMILIE